MWNKIDDIRFWFSDVIERFKFVKDFNISAKESFINGEVPTLLEAKTTTGFKEYRHPNSKFLGGGFRIKAVSGAELSKIELINIGKVVTDNPILVRKLVSLGWDTLEVHDSVGMTGLRWKLWDYSEIKKLPKN